MSDTKRASGSYWEEVRAVMVLLTTALANATAPLIEVPDAAGLAKGKPNTHRVTLSVDLDLRTRCATLATPSPSRAKETAGTVATTTITQFIMTICIFCATPELSHALFITRRSALTPNASNDAREDSDPESVSSLRDPTVLSQEVDEPTLHTHERLRHKPGLAPARMRAWARANTRASPPTYHPPSADDVKRKDRASALGPDAESSDSG